MLNRENVVDFEDLKFGVEVEMAGVNRLDLVKTCSRELNYSSDLIAYGGYSTLQLIDPVGRSWKFMNDSSIAYLNDENGTELVTPILRGDADIQVLQTILSIARRLGAIAHKSCGIHIHCDSATHSVSSVARLMSFWHFNENFIYDILGTSDRRKNSWAKPMPTEKVQRIRRIKPKTKNQLAECWVDNPYFSPSHYDPVRYHALNLNNLWREIETIECRAFQASLNGTKINAYIKFFLAINAKAINSSNMAPCSKAKINKPMTRISVLLTEGLKLTGDRYKSTRRVLMTKLKSTLASR